MSMKIPAKAAVVVLTFLAGGCSQATIDEVNAAFAPIDRAWNQAINNDPLLGLGFALDGMIAAEQIRMYKQLGRQW